MVGFARQDRTPLIHSTLFVSYISVGIVKDRVAFSSETLLVFVRKGIRNITCYIGPLKTSGKSQRLIGKHIALLYHRITSYTGENEVKGVFI